ncbi:MAG TPA: MmgE/PrpD family protein [Blastocatellia bacterium]
MSGSSTIRAEDRSGPDLTRQLAARSSAISFAELPSDIVELARQCLLDWLGVTLAGASEPAVKILIDEIREQGGNPQASLIPDGVKVTTLQAGLVNGTASHALDYDDVNWSLEGHPSAAVIPGLLALAEYRKASGVEFITAFVAGYETACRIGRLVSPSHYKHGFHATATVGTFGAAAACARLLGLDAETTATALGIAGTQAAGLKSMFGTMCKPLHAGKAAQNGLFAASLAARAFESRMDVLECPQGFSATQSDDFNFDKALEDPASGYYLRANLFKYHAACYLTHSVVECCRRLRGQVKTGLDSIKEIRIHVDRTLDGVCNIPEPRTGNEAKFSLRLMAAFALAGIDTSSSESYTAQNCADQSLIALRDKVAVEFESGWPATKAEVTLVTEGIGAPWKLHDSRDSGIPAEDLKAQRARLEAKFHSLVSPILGADNASRLSAAIGDLERMQNVEGLLLLCNSNR